MDIPQKWVIPIVFGIVTVCGIIGYNIPNLSQNAYSIASGLFFGGIVGIVLFFILPPIISYLSSRGN